MLKLNDKNLKFNAKTQIVSGVYAACDGFKIKGNKGRFEMTFDFIKAVIIQ
jgi:ubiquinone biosynthesis protein COQ9